MSDKPRTLEELAEYIIKYADGIWVRDEPHPDPSEPGETTRNWQLSAMPAKMAMKHMARFLVSGQVPVRVLTETERAQERAKR